MISFLWIRRHAKHGEPHAGFPPHDICEGAQQNRKEASKVSPQLGRREVVSWGQANIHRRVPAHHLQRVAPRHHRQGWRMRTTCDDFSVVYYFAPLSFVCSSTEQHQRNWLACPILAALITGQDFMNDWGLRVDKDSTFKHSYDPVSEVYQVQLPIRNRGNSVIETHVYIQYLVCQLTNQRLGWNISSNIHWIYKCNSIKTNDFWELCQKDFFLGITCHVESEK